jgi:CO/xanthine dehydrogenase FAD-binding subunit
MNPALAGIDLQVPAALSDALERLAADPSLKPFAGGTDLMVLLEAGLLEPGRYLSLWGLRELRGIAETADGIAIGALTTYTDVRRSKALDAYPLLARAAEETGSVATQNRGTIGGNIANASPAADTPPALLVYDAELELVSAAGRRRVRYDLFHTGYKQMDLRPGEIIGAVHLPRRAAGWRDYYRKVGTRRAQAISKVCFAGSIQLARGIVSDVRIALGSVAPTVVRCAGAEQALRGRAIDARAIEDAGRALVAGIAPIDDIRSTARYRAAVARNLLSEFLTVQK